MKRIIKKIRLKSKWLERLKRFFGKIKNKFIAFFLSLLLGAMGVVAWKFSYNFDVGFNVLLKLAGFITITGALQGLIILLPESKFRTYSIAVTQLFIGIIGYILEYGIMLFNVVFALILIFYSQLLLLVKIQEYTNPLFLTSDLSYFISFLITLLLLAYTGKKVVFCISKILLLPQRRESWYPKFLVRYRNFLKRIDFRKWAFFIATAIYLISVIEGLIEMHIIKHEFWVQSKGVTLEAFLAFLAIDRFIVNFQENLIKK